MKFTYSEHASGKSVLTALKEPGQCPEQQPLILKLNWSFFFSSTYWLLLIDPLSRLAALLTKCSRHSPSLQSAEAAGPTPTWCCWQWSAASCWSALCCWPPGRWSSLFTTGGSLHASRVHAREPATRWWVGAGLFSLETEWRGEKNTAESPTVSLCFFRHLEHVAVPAIKQYGLFFLNNKTFTSSISSLLNLWGDFVKIDLYLKKKLTFDDLNHIVTHLLKRFYLLRLFWFLCFYIFTVLFFFSTVT